MSKQKQETLFWGVLLLLLGALFMLNNFGVHFNLWRFLGKFWPAILIIIGLKNIYFHLQEKNKREKEQQWDD